MSDRTPTARSGLHVHGEQPGSPWSSSEQSCLCCPRTFATMAGLVTFIPAVQRRPPTTGQLLRRSRLFWMLVLTWDVAWAIVNWRLHT